MKDFFTEFYIESKGLLDKRAEEEITKVKEIQFNKNLEEILSKNADFKTNVVNFAKNHSKATESAVAGALLGGASELVMPSRTDQFGRPSTNMTEIGKRALLGGALGGASGEIKNRTRNYLNKMGTDKTAIIGPLIDGATFMIPSMIGYHMGKKKGKEDYTQGKSMKDVSQAKLWLLPGTLGHTIGKANAHIDSYLDEKRDASSLDDYYDNHADEKVKNRYKTETPPYMKKIMEKEWKRRVTEMNEKDIEKKAGLSDIAGKVLGNTAGAATKLHDLGSKAGKYLKDPVVNRTLIGGGIGASLGIPAGLQQYENNKRIEEGKTIPIDGLDFLSPKAGGITKGILTGVQTGAAGAILGNQLGKNPHLENALRKAYHGAKSFVRPDTSSVKNFLKDPVVQHTALGAGAGAGFGLGSSTYHDEDSGKIKFDPHISNILGGTLIGGGLGALSGGLTRAHSQLDNMSDMINKIKQHHKDAPAAPVKDSINNLLNKPKSLAGKNSEKGFQLSPGVELLDKSAGFATKAHELGGNALKAIKNLPTNHPIATYGLGGAGIGAGLGALGAEEGDKLKGALAGAAVFGGLGTGLGLHQNSKQLMKGLPKKQFDLRRQWDKWKYEKKAFSMTPLMQTAGKYMAKNPRVGGAVLGAGVGALGNTLSGEDNLGFSMAAGAGIGALGGKALLGQAKKMNNPILGQNFRRGAIQEGLNARNLKRPISSPIASQSMQSAPSLGSLVDSSGARNVGPQVSTLPHNPITTPSKPQEMDWSTMNKPSFINRASNKLKSMVG